MNADIRWIDNPEIFRVNQIAAHSDHEAFITPEAMEEAVFTDGSDIANFLNDTKNF